MPRTICKAEFKSAERVAFEFYLRTGRRLIFSAIERKFNPYHDPRNGRFTFAPGGSRSITSPIFSDRRELWQSREKEAAPEKERSIDASPSQSWSPDGVDHAVLAEEPSASIQAANFRPNPRARAGGNGGPPFYDPLVLEQAFPGLRSSPAGAIVAIGDTFLDLTAPTKALTAEIHQALVKKIVAQIRALDPDYQLASLGAPQTIEGMANEIKALRFDRALAFYRARGEMKPMQIEVLRIMQERTDSAYEEAVVLYDTGRLRPRLSREEAIGNYVDGAVRRTLRQRFNTSQIDYSAGQPIRVVGREYNTSGTERTFRIPDARVDKVAFDVTLTRKTLSTQQVRGFFNSDFKPDSVIIIRPRQLGKGNTYLIRRPRG